jgi:hypothetical protein
MVTTLLLLLVPAARPADVAVVCPPAFRAEMTPWVAHRQQQGHEIAWIDPHAPDIAIRDRLLELHKSGSLKHVLLVGDVLPGRQTNFARGDTTVPTHFVRAKVNVHWGSEPEIATDLPYADLDGDQLPDVAVGRWPADSALDVRRLVEKSLAYEANADYGPWRRRINFIAGLGGFGALADAALEAAAKKLITDSIPAGYSTSMTYGSWRSPYCPDPRAFRVTTLDRLNEGCLFWVYIGHGQRRQVDWVRVPGGAFPILADRDVAHLRCAGGPPIACFLACYAGAFDSAEDCLAEQMLLAPDGPAAVFAGSRVTMPYAMSVMGLAILQTCFGEAEGPATLGTAILEAKRRMMVDEGQGANRQALDALARLISPAPADLVAERAEHLALFNLLGDPLLRLALPGEAHVSADMIRTPKNVVSVHGSSPIDGLATVELVVRRDRLTFVPPVRRQFEADALILTRYDEIYRHANDPRLAVGQLKVVDGKFAGEVACPAGIRGPCHVRVFITGENACASGACDLDVSVE